MKLVVVKRKRHKVRAQSGVYLIEFIMAIATSSMLAAALVLSMAQTERLSVAGQNQIAAAAIAQEQIDNVRNTLYGSLVPGTYTLLVNKTDSGQTGPAGVNPRPLLIDTVNLDWRTPAERLQGVSMGSAVALNEFQATVTETIGAAPGFTPDKALMVTVTVQWQEGPSTKTYVVSTLVAKQGIHIY